jgi:hypothetical protein
VPPGRLDVEGVFPDLFDRGNAGERKEETEVIGEIRIRAGDRFAIHDVLCLEALPSLQ